MPQFKTLQFPNTPSGQTEKTKALHRESNRGLAMVSETITEGEFQGKKRVASFSYFHRARFSQDIKRYNHANSSTRLIRWKPALDCFKSIIQ